MKIAVLGCGPAGLLAAYGAKEAQGRAEVAIFSKARKSEMFGAQYLHDPIPGLSGDPVTVDYQLRGDVESYRRKVYGPKWDGTVSPDDYAGEHKAWDIREAYDMLWDIYSDYINDVDLDPAGIKRINNMGFHKVINTVPLADLCHQGHTFGAVEITAAGDAPDRGVDVGSLYSCPDNTVVCNGEDSPSWYRMSRIFGHTTIEWPNWVERVPVPSAAKVQKPTFNNCDCWPYMVKAGRYGSWTKGVLSHDAYYKGYEAAL